MSREEDLWAVAEKFAEAKELGKTRTCQEVVRITGLPYDVVHRLLMGEAYLRTEAQLMELVVKGDV